MKKPSQQKNYVHGSAGGSATFEKYGSEHMRDISKNYHKKRRRLERMAQKGTLTKPKRK